MNLDTETNRQIGRVQGQIIALKNGRGSAENVQEEFDKLVDMLDE